MRESEELLGLPEITTTAPAPRRSRHRRRKRRRAAPLVAVLVTLAFLGGVAYALDLGAHKLAHLVRGAPADYSGNGSGQVLVAVTTGETATQIGQTLYQQHVVASVAAFADAATANPNSTSIDPGDYQMHYHMKASQALQLLLTATPLGRVTIPEGFSVAEALPRIAAAAHLSLAQVKAAAADPAALGAPSYVRSNIEGFLFPDTYDVPPGISATKALSQMVADFNQVAGQIDLAGGAAAVHQTPYGIVILASIIQHEGRHAADFPKIARVFYNRMAAGMPIGSDATLFYLLGPNHGPLTGADLKINSPYNTRTHLGLPPTPIDNPGKTALLAALHPAAGPWLYFTTMDQAGDVNYETTYAQHQRDAAVAASRGLH